MSVKRESLKVRITAKDDSIVFQYLAPHPAIKLRGYILGYGGRYSKQNISLPDNGEPIELDVEFTPKYLIAVHPVAEYSSASAVKKCKGSVELHRPLQVMINALTSTSVLLTWGQNYEEECNADVDSECTDERHFTVRYREKEKNKKWLYQFCPTTKTVVDKLKPNTVYEFGVRVTKPKEDSIWGRATAHTTSATTSPSNTRTEQVKINKFNPYFKKDRNNGDMAKLKPSGKVNHIGPKHRKPDVITSAPGADLLVFDTLKSNRNPPSKEHRPMQSNPLPENDVVNKVEKKGIDSKPTSRNDKKEIAKQKAPATPSKANESKRPSSVNSSLPSNPGLEPHATGKPQFIEFQVPSSNHSNLFTSERASDLETKDKQQSTESEIPSSTKMPFTILSTTSKHTAEDKQKLPEIKAPSSTNSFLITSNPAHASNPVDIKQLKEPEVPYPNSSPFHPTSEPDAKDVEKLTEPEVPFSSISSFNPTTEPGTLGMQKFTDLETPLSSTSFFSNSKMTSTLDVTDGQKSTEKVTEGPPSNGNFYSIPSSTSELDTMDEQQFSEYVVPHSISSNVNTLSTPSEPDNVDKQEFTEHEVTSSNSSFFTTSTASSELHPPERQPNSEDELRSSSSSSFNGLNTLKPDVLDKQNSTGPGVHSSSSSISFTSNTSELNALGSQKSTELEVPSSTSSVLITSNTRAEADSINHNPFTEYNPPLANNPSRNEPGYQDKQPITEHYQSSIENSTHFNLNPVLEFDAPGHQGYTGQISPKHLSLSAHHELPISDTPYVFSPTPPAEHVSAGKTQFSDQNVPTDTLHVSSQIPVYELDNIEDRKLTDRKLSTANPPHMFSGTPVSELDKIENNKDHKLSTAGTRYVFSPSPVPEPDKIIRSESKDQIVRPADTPYVFSSTHVYELENSQSSGTHKKFYDMDQNVPTADTLHVSSQTPVHELDKIEDRKFTDRKLSTANLPHMFSGTPVSELDKIENNKDHKLSTAGTRYVFSPSPVPEPDKIIRSESKDHIVPTADTPYVFSSTPVYELENVEDNTSSGTHKKFYDLDHIVSTADTPYVFSSTSVYESENIEDIKSSGTHKKFYDMEHKLSTADTPYVISGTRAYEYNIEDHKFTDHKPPTFDTPHVFSGIPVTELTNIEDNKPTGHKLPTVDTPHVFSGSSASELDKLEDNKSTDIQIKQNAVREQHFASLQPKDHKLTTADTPLMFSGAPVSELDNIQDHKLTDNKASTTDSTYVLSGISAKEFDNIGDRKPIGRKLPTADTPHVFSGSSASGLDKLEDNKSTDHKPPTANTPQVFSGIAVSELDNLEGNKSTDLERLTSDTIQVFRPSHVSQLGSTGGKKRTGTDPMADPLSKPKSDAKWNILEPSADVQSSTSSNPLSEKDATGLATETTNLNMFTEHNEVENTTVLSSTPISEIDSLGKERYTGPHVKYFGKDPNVPCSINEALKYFVNKNHTNVKVTTAPRYPPTNVTILTVEGCSTFVIVVWEKNDNDSATEFELVSTALGPDNETEKIVTVTNQTHITVENLSPNTSYVFLVKPKNRLGVGPPSEPVPFVTESADPRVSEYVPGKAAIWSPYRFKFDSFSECQGKQYVKRTWYRKFVGIILCNSLRYKIYLSDKLSGVFYNIGDLSGHGEDHCQFVDSFLDGRTGHHLLSAQLPVRPGFYRSLRQEPVMFGTIGGHTHISYVHWYECGIAIPGKW
eukprot:gi/632956685/ref/XP_007894080.1/ PREDICTED: target of Nesh-SH3 [Callorhinchus milii]